MPDSEDLPQRSEQFTVTMLGGLRAPFERWLTARNLKMAHIHGCEPDDWIVVPANVPPRPPNWRAGDIIPFGRNNRR